MTKKSKSTKKLPTLIVMVMVAITMGIIGTLAYIVGYCDQECIEADLEEQNLAAEFCFDKEKDRVEYGKQVEVIDAVIYEPWDISCTYKYEKANIEFSKTYTWNEVQEWKIEKVYS